MTTVKVWIKKPGQKDDDAVGVDIPADSIVQTLKEVYLGTKEPSRIAVLVLKFGGTELSNRRTYQSYLDESPTLANATLVAEDGGCVVSLGWKRDLTRECIEPNPGPTLEKVLQSLREALGKRAADFEAGIVQLETDIQAVHGDELVMHGDVRVYAANNEQNFVDVFGQKKGIQIRDLLLNEVLPPADKTDKTDRKRKRNGLQFVVLESEQSSGDSRHIIIIDDASSVEIDISIVHTIRVGGSNSMLYGGCIASSKSVVVVKVESSSAIIKQVDNEFGILRQLESAGCLGVPKALYLGREKYGNGRVLVTADLGLDLGSLVQNNMVFGICVVKCIAYKLLLILQSIHRAGIVHRDIKPHHIIYLDGKITLVDFGLAINIGKPTKFFAGTVCYCSLASMFGEYPSPLDDLESLAYTLLFLVNGCLPWDAVSDAEVIAMKQQCRQMPDKLFLGLPQCFVLYFKYVTSLVVGQQPNYIYMCNLFRCKQYCKNPKL